MATSKKGPRKKATKEKSVVEGGRARVLYILPNDLVAQYADNINILHTESEFVLSFTQIQHPLVGTNEEMQRLETVQAKCVARIIVAPEKMMAIINAMQNNLNIYMQSMQERVDKLNELKAAQEAEGK